MEILRSDLGSPDGGQYSAGEISPTMSNDSALPTSSAIHENDQDEETDDGNIELGRARSKSTDAQRIRVESSTSGERFKYGIRYITDGFIRKVTKLNMVSRIQSLDLSNLRDKKVRYIENLQNLTNLEHLDLSNNLIERIDGLKSLKKLKSLNLSRNFIRTINNLEDLSKLERLELRRNQITEIPVWLSKRLVALKLVDLAENKIDSFDQVARLRTAYELRHVFFQGNPIEQHEHYRLLVISYIPSLEQIDGIPIDENERQQAKEQFIQQEVQNLIQELERRDHECRRLNHQATSQVEKLEKTSDKLNVLETKTSVQQKQIQDLEERLATSEALLQRKTALLNQACEKQCQLEQELEFYKIDLKFDRFGQNSALNKQPTNVEIQRILGPTPPDKFFRPDDEAIYNEKLVRLAYEVAELTVLKEKHRRVEEILAQSNERKLSKATIEQLGDDLTLIQNEMMNKISEVQELKLFLHDARTDRGEKFAEDLEQVTIELKLDEFVRQHIAQIKQQEQEENDDLVVNNYRQSTTNAALSSSSGKRIVDDRVSIDPRIEELESTIAEQRELLRRKSSAEREKENQLINLKLTVERQEIEHQARIKQIEEMAEREKYRVLKHLEDEKRISREDIEKSETMIEQLKRELSSERQKKSSEQKNFDAVRDIYRKISPRRASRRSAAIDDEREDSPRKNDDPFFASTPRDQFFFQENQFSSDTGTLQKRLDEHFREQSPEQSFSNGKNRSRTSSLPPTPKRRNNSKFVNNLFSVNLENSPSFKNDEPKVEEDEQELLFRLDNYVKSSEAFVSKLANLCPTTTNNDSGYSSQQTGRDGQIDNPKIQALFSNERFPFFDKTLIDPAQFNRDYTVGVVTLSNEHHQNIHRQSPKMGNVTLYPTPEGYVLGPHSITVDQRNRTPKKLATSPTRSINQTDSQYFACVNIPPAALSSNRPPYSSPERANAVRVQGPVILRQDTVVNSEKVSPISVKIRSLKYPQLEKGTMTDSDSIRREIDRTADEIDYLRTKLDRQPTDFVDQNQLNLFRDVLDEQRRELQRVRNRHQDFITAGRDSDLTRRDATQEIHRIQRNIHEHLSPKLLGFIEETNDIFRSGRFVPLDQSEHWVCTVPRHADLEEIISQLEREIDSMKTDRRRLERNLAKKSMKLDALDLAASTKRSKSIVEAENLEDEIYVLEQKLVRKQREMALARDQLRQMTELSQQVIRDLKAARQKQTLAKRQTKAFENKIDSLTKKLYRVAQQNKEVEETHAETRVRLENLRKEQNHMEKANDEKRAMNLVLDEQIRHSFQAFNSLLNSSIKTLQELTAASSTDDDFRFNNLPMTTIQLPSNIPIDEIQRQTSHFITENSRLLNRYHTILQQERQRSANLQREISDNEKHLANLKGNLQAHNEQLKRNAQELLQDKNVLEELEQVKEMKSDKLGELDRLIERRQMQEKQSQAEVERLNNEQQRLKKTSRDLQLENDQIRHAIEADRSVLVEMKNESTRLRDQIKSFLEEKETLDETVDFLAKKCETLHNECKQKETHLPVLVNQIDEKLTICKNLEEEIKKFKSEKTRCLEEVAEMKEKIERKRAELIRSPNEIEFEQRIRRQQNEFERLNVEIEDRNRTLAELNAMISYAKSIMKNIEPADNSRNNFQNQMRLDQKQQKETNAYYETKIQRLTRTLDEKEQQIRSLHQQLMTNRDEVALLQQKVQNQETNADSMRNSMQLELDKLRHWLEIYENRKSMLRPQYHEALKELELKLHEQETFYRKQIKELDHEMKKKFNSRSSDDSGFLSEVTPISTPIDFPPTDFLREQIQNIFSHHAQELDKCNSKYKNNLTNLKNRLHELENSTTTTMRFDS